MFKRFFIGIIVFCSGLVWGNDMPPMPPFMQSNMQSKPSAPSRNIADQQAPDAKAKTQPNAPKSDFQNKLQSSPGCSELPPMIIFLPPPMEKALITCRNHYFKPSKALAKERLDKLENTPVDIMDLEIMEGFREVYKVTYKIKKKQKIKYCNKDINACFGL